MERWNRFWRWWMSELSSFVPRTDPRVSAHRRLPYEVHLSGTAATLYLRQSLRAPLNQNNRVADAPDLSELLSTHRWKGKAALSFDDRLALRKSMPLSRALYPDADAIIASELTRTSPFKPGQTLGLWQEIEPGRIEHAVLRLADVRAADQVARANGIQIEAVAFRPQQQQSWKQLRAPNGSLWYAETDRRWRNIAIGSLLAAIMASCIYALARNAEHASANDSLLSRIEEVRPKALERRKEIDAIAAEVSAFSNLANARKTKPRLVFVWDALARILPDDTWLQMLTFRDGKIQVEGNARNAEALISLVENSHMFRNAKFAAPVVDQQNAGSRFVMSFEVEGIP